MTMNFVVISEGLADFTIAAELADRVFVSEVDWLEEQLLDSQRRWIGEDEPGRRLSWKSIPSRARDVGIRVRGHFSGEPALPDAQAARRAIAYVLWKFEMVDAIVLIRDADDQNERRQGLEQARVADASSLTIVIGVANAEREAWVISGFEPQDPQEQQRLDSEIQNLGWNPCARSHDLTAGKDDQALRSPKRVLAMLTNGDWSRQEHCWRATPLAVLQTRGQHNGLAEYLDEIKRHLVPAITGYEGKPDQP